MYRAVDLDFIPPELRENCGEFKAAEQHLLPKLIEKENLRGTFHCHTFASDGHNSLEEMAEAAQELGLDYLGIADHSRTTHATAELVDVGAGASDKDYAGREVKGRVVLASGSLASVVREAVWKRGALEWG